MHLLHGASGRWLGKLSALIIPSNPTYQVGSLTYNRRQLGVVFFFLLFGDFCLSLMEFALPAMLPITLRQLDAPNKLVSLLVVAIPSLLGLIMNPIISFRSDRHRGPHGRRIPYLIWPTPAIAITLGLIGYGPSIGAWLHEHVLTSVAQPLVVLGFIGVLVVLFQFFNMFVASVYYYLLNDVVPTELLGRFFGLFRVVGSAAGFLFNYRVIGMAETHATDIYMWFGLIYMGSFMIMCHYIKEGTYPEPPAGQHKPSMFSSMITYFKECFSLRYYWFFYIGLAGMIFAATGLGTFRVFFAQQVGLSVDMYGKVQSIGAIMGVCLFYPFGLVADRIHPLRLMIIASVLTVVANLAGFAFIHDLITYVVITCLGHLFSIMYSAANAPLMPALLPRSKYGQFSSAASIIISASMVGGNFLVGALIDWSGNNYRLPWLFAGIAGLIPMASWLMVYKGVMRHGGFRNYQAPEIPDAS